MEMAGLFRTATSLPLLHELSRILDGVYFFNLLVAPNRFDSWKPEGESAAVSIARLHCVKSNF
jgi:hypothetical protein